MTSPAGATAPSRRLTPSALRRVTTVVLLVGTVVSVVAAFGPEWAVRGGIVVAIVAMVLACALAWRELAVQRRRHAAESLAASRAHGQALRADRQHNAAVLQVVTDRNTAALAELDRQIMVIAGLRTEIATLRGDKAALTANLARHDATIAELRDTVRAREAEILVLTADDSDDAEVHVMPRRVLVDTGDDVEPDGADRWSDGDHPTVVDLPLVDVPVLPNVEADRRLA